MIDRETNRYGNEDWVRPVNEEEYRSFYDAAESAEAAESNGNSNEEDDHDQSPRTRKRPKRGTVVRFDFSAMEDNDSDGDEEYSPDDRNYNPWLAFDNHPDEEASDDEASYAGCFLWMPTMDTTVKKVRIMIQMNPLTT